MTAPYKVTPLLSMTKCLKPLPSCRQSVNHFGLDEREVRAYLPVRSVETSSAVELSSTSSSGSVLVA